MSADRILVTCKQMQVELPHHEARLREAGYDVLSPQLVGQAFSEQELKDLLPGVVGMIAGDDPLTADVLASGTDLKVLIRWGIGMDSVDHAAAKEHGIVVHNTPGVFGDEVADSAFGYVLLLARGHHTVDAAVRQGQWPKVEGTSLAGERLGVVGLGSIGRAVARRGSGFSMDVVAFDPYADPAAAAEVGAELLPLEDLLRTSRFVVLASPLTPETFHVIDAKALSLMRPDAYLVNVGRGPLVDEPALVEALEAGALAGAGLDVFEVEPLPANSPLRGMPNVVLGAHNGSNTRQGVARASADAVARLLDALGDR
ncbi:MAG TPA: phosphoglycerate dehydrogenase [Mycobacteriales bacterium]|nr:phosphoglycerate dehydrogenase [Mycobacteriales bacterium]